MKKWFLLIFVVGVMPLTMMAQDDDMYFVPSKRSAQRAAVDYGSPRDTYYSGSNRDVDEYNRRGSFYEMLPADTLGDIINFSGGLGIYPDSTLNDYQLTQQMSRFDGYEPGESFWAGYVAGRRDSWHSPWYYSSYYPFYDPWYWDSWYWYDPWYYGGWYGGWHGGWGYSWHHYGHGHGSYWGYGGGDRTYRPRISTTGSTTRSGIGSTARSAGVRSSSMVRSRAGAPAGARSCRSTCCRAWWWRR